jgi:hypothetical protein
MSGCIATQFSYDVTVTCRLSKLRIRRGEFDIHLDEVNCRAIGPEVVITYGLPSRPGRLRYCRMTICDTCMTFPPMCACMFASHRICARIVFVDLGHFFDIRRFWRLGTVARDFLGVCVCVCVGKLKLRIRLAASTGITEREDRNMLENDVGIW